jgi:hypothetical protein
VGRVVRWSRSIVSIRRSSLIDFGSVGVGEGGDLDEVVVEHAVTAPGSCAVDAGVAGSVDANGAKNRSSSRIRSTRSSSDGITSASGGNSDSHNVG